MAGALPIGRDITQEILYAETHFLSRKQLKNRGLGRGEKAGESHSPQPRTEGYGTLRPVTLADNGHGREIRASPCCGGPEVAAESSVAHDGLARGVPEVSLHGRRPRRD